MLRTEGIIARGTESQRAGMYAIQDTPALRPNGHKYISLAVDSEYARTLAHFGRFRLSSVHSFHSSRPVIGPRKFSSTSYIAPSSPSTPPQFSCHLDALLLR